MLRGIQLGLQKAGLLAFLALVMLFIAFMLMHLGSAAPAVMLAGDAASPEAVAAVTADYALDQPVFVQFPRFIIRVMQGDLGRSWLTGNNVADELLRRAPATVELMLYAIMLGGLIGVPLGVWAGLAHGRLRDGMLRGLALLGQAIPGYVLALLLILVFFRVLGFAPAPDGRIDPILGVPVTVTGSYLIDAILVQDAPVARSALARLVLPVLCLGIGVATAVMLRVRAAVLAQIDREHIAFARAQGLPREMLAAIAMRGASPAITTAIGHELAVLLGATAVIERVFNWGGMGHFGLGGFIDNDFAVVQGFVLIAGLFALVVLGIAHLLSRWLAPDHGR